MTFRRSPSQTCFSLRVPLQLGMTDNMNRGRNNAVKAYLLTPVLIVHDSVVKNWNDRQTDRRNKVIHRRVQGELECTMSTAQLYSSVFTKSPPSHHERTSKIIFVSQDFSTNGNEKETKRQLSAYGDYPAVANCRIKFPAIFRIIFGIFRSYLKNSYSFMSRILARPLRMFWGTLVENYWYSSHSTVKSTPKHLNKFVRT